MLRSTIYFAVGAIAALGMIRPVAAEPDSDVPTLQAFELADYYNLDSESEAVISVGYCDQDQCAGASCESCEGNCGRQCCRPQRRFYAGIEATFLAPDTVGSSTRVDITDIAGPSTNSYFGDSGDDIIAGPRVWLGVQGDDWGVQFRYWELDNTATTVVPFGGTVGSSALDVFEAYTIDLELTRKFRRRQTDMVASFGVRHARLSNFNSVSATEIIGTDLQTATAWSNRQIDGTGLTFGLTGLRRIRSSNWSIFWNTRGSLLWGDADLRVETTATGVGPGGSGAGVNVAAANSDETLFIGEFQLGLQRDYKLKWIPASAFFRGAFEYQFWDVSSGGTASSVTGVTLAGTSSSVATASASDQDTSLVGFTLGTGFYW